MFNDNYQLNPEDGDILSSNAIASLEIFLGDNWHQLERSGNISTRWISNDASIMIASNKMLTSALSFRVASFYRPRHIQVYLNDDPLVQEKVPTSFLGLKVQLSLKPGSNVVRFHSNDGHERPMDIACLHSDDARYLSFVFHSFRLEEPGTTSFNYKIFPLKLNLGCGLDRRKGYLNVDLQDSSACDLVADMRDLSMLPSDTYEEILAQDCLEHIPYIDAKATLQEWHRLLKVGGTIAIRTSDIVGLIELFKERQSVEGHQELLKYLFGTQVHEGDYHLGGFTSLLMEYYLREAGFSNIQIASKDQWLLEATARK